MAYVADTMQDAYPGEEGQSDRVREILRTGARIFAQKGFERTSMRDISDACGVSKALLYHHFESKDNLYAQIAFNSTQHLYEYVEARVPREGPAGDKIRALMVAMATFFHEHRWAWIAASTAFWTDPDRHRLEMRITRRKALEGMLRGLIQEGIAHGEFNDSDPAMTGRLILSGINWMHRWYDPDKSLTPGEIATAYFDTIYQGLAKR
ncbi:MAG: TetR/AcrR family transcriptional regulator [Burkholderiaceae bacterium]